MIGKEPTRRRLRWGGLVVAAICVAAYGNTLTHEFAMDDSYNVVENEQIRSLKNLPRFFSAAWGATAIDPYYRKINQAYWRPLVTLSLAIDHQLWGLRPAGYHLTNLLLHAGVCLLLLVLFARLTRSLPVALTGALLFALHPVHTEAVNLISYRTELQASLFAVAALVLHARPDPGRLHWLWLALLYVCGLASKETAVTLPAWLLLLDLARGQLPAAGSGRSGVKDSLSLPRLARTYLPLVLCLAGYLLLRHSLLQEQSASNINFFAGLDATTRLMSVMKIYAVYLRLLFVPWPLLAFYDWTVLPPASSWADGQAWAGLIALVATAFLAVVLWSRRRLLGLGLGWWLVGLIPFMHLVPLPVGAAERFLYLPSVGICLVLAVGFGWLLERRGRAALALGLLLAALMAFGTVVRNTHWRSDLHLLEQAVRDHPESFNAHFALGKIYHRRRQLRQAIDQFTLADKILPDMRVNVSWLAGSLLEAGQHRRAVTLLERATAELGPEPDLVRLLRRARAGVRDNPRRRP